MFANKRKESVRTLTNTRLIYIYFLHGDLAIRLTKICKFPQEFLCSVESVCEKQPFKQIFFKKKVYYQSHWELRTICLKAAFL